MYHVLPNTLEEIKASTLFQTKEWSNHWLSGVGPLIKAFEKNNQMVSPEREAVDFYLHNHLASLIMSKYTPQQHIPFHEYEMLRRYVSIASNVALRLMYYVLLITARESRHLKNKTGFYQSSHLNDLGDYKDMFVDFHNNATNSSEEDVAYRIKNNPPTLPLGCFIKGLELIFYHGSFNSSYGGTPWGNIAKTARKVINGETSFEIFADSSFALCHNGGPMFNKGMLYNHYSSDDLIRILDAQRAGMMPQLINSNYVKNSFISPWVGEAMMFGLEHFSEKFSGTIDWSKVQSLGSVLDYGYEDKPSKISGEAKKKAHEMAKTLAAEEKKKFYIMPDVWALKLERADLK
jgi:hypothetical protein